MFKRFNRISLFSRRLPTPIRLAFGLALMVFISTLLLMLPFVGAERPLKLNEAFFTAVSALTVTGLSIISPGSALSTWGQMLLVTLVQVGGVGYMVMAVIIFRLLGRSISFADRLALRDSFGLLDMNAILVLIRRVLLTVFGLEAIGAFLLWLQWRAELGPGRAVLFAVFHAVSAFCNAGFDLFAGTPGFTGIPKDTFSLTILGVLIFIGGLGIPVVADVLLVVRRHRPHLSLHSRLTLLVTVFLLLLGMLGLLIAETRPGATLAELPIGRALLISAFQSVSARTAGFSAIDNFYNLAPSSQLLKIILMFIGTAPASMGGGITTGTLVVLGLALWAFARGRETPHIFGRSLGAATLRRASAVLTISLAVVVSATWILLITHPGAPLDRVLFEVISAFATCGLSLGYTSNLSIFGQVTICLVMFWGRLGAITIIMALAQLTPARLIAYPEEQILI
ncbi:MAG: potassium transporter TrkG [Anaerolineales bacterium]|jgi:trk system potassium uptake protein TrkH|nr:potassium transporter TrkG [Anaerolineales bacterium]